MNATHVNYYALLGVSPSADSATVRGAYRRLARRYHPDMLGGMADVMCQLNEAWAVLRDPNGAQGLRRAAVGT